LVFLGAAARAGEIAIIRVGGRVLVAVPALLRMLNLPVEEQAASSLDGAGRGGGGD